MVEILCPHCDEEIELDDDASGEFSCPFCEGEFEWNMEPETGNGRGVSTGGGTPQTGGGIPPTSPIEWTGHAFSIFTLIFVIICLGSGSLYSITASATVEGESFDIIDISYGVNDYSGREFNMPVSSTYVDEITELEAERAEMCDWFPDECSTHNAEEIEILESWNKAGNYLGFFVIMALLFSIAVVMFRLVLMLDFMEAVILNERMFITSTYGKTFLPFFTGGCLLIGMILFMILSPGANLYEGLLNEAFPSAELSSGFGMVVWFSLLLSIGYSVFSVFEMSAE
jgi:hypothetical protein